MKLWPLILLMVGCLPAKSLPHSGILHGDLSFSTDERKEIELALTTWSAFTDNRVSYWVVWDSQLGGETVTRIDPWDPRYAERQARVADHLSLLGWQNDRRIYLVPAHTKTLRLVMQHELGHQIGLGHNPDPHSLMAELFYETELTESDRKMLK